MKFHQGKFYPKNPGKYRGDLTQIVYRSSWEQKAMQVFDTNPNILEWASEGVVIPYLSPIDNRLHRYFPDFWLKMRTKDGKIKTCIYEIKPFAQTQEPKVQKRHTKRYIQEVFTWGVNSAKWEAANEFCAKNGWEFNILTESDLGI